MPDRPSKPDAGRRAESGAPKPPGAPGKAGSAFDVWLERGLHKLFDDIAKEPLPDALMKIIEEDRSKE